MSILSAEKISKSYSEKILIDDISLGINEGEKIGLIGINGTGKSTLLKILAGIEISDSGRIIYGNGIKIEYLPQEPDFESGTTVLEQVFKGSSPVMELLREYEAALQDANDNTEDSRLQKKLIALSQKMENMKAWSIETEAKSILTKLGIFDYKSNVDTLSGGERKRIAIASALITTADLLILDEPTNHIDNDTVDWLEKYLNRNKGALLMVTHDRYLLDRVVNRMIELDNGKLYSYQANYSKYLEMKAEREDLAEASEKKRQGLIRRELEWIRRGAQARSTKQKARIDRFEKLTEQQKPMNNGNVEMQVSFSRLGKKIINIENISKSFQSGVVVKDFSHNLFRDDRVGIIGPNGCGKSTLMKMISGKLKPDAGKVETGETVKIGYFAQENEDIENSELRVIEYIREQAEVIATGDGILSASQMLERFLFPPSVQWTPVMKLSGGEKRRLYLLRILMGAPNVLMLDEPTNDLDIQTLTILESYLDEFPGAVIVVSHDRYFLDRIVDRIFAFEGNGCFNQYLGNYSDYTQAKEARERLSEELSVKPAKSKSTEKAENKKDKLLKFSYKDAIEFEQIDDIIMGLENDMKQIEAQIVEASSDFEKLQQLLEKKEEVEAKYEDAIERWAYLNELADEIERNKSTT